ncbi:MAG: hypothetical protein FJX80_03570 [Bacteroidetes bacterium]|nr:hypothetical protein [Bacteroidota bacterium]
MKVQILIFLIVCFSSNVFVSQTKIRFSNRSIKLYDSPLNKGIDELLQDENTHVGSESDSFGLYEIDLTKKSLTLFYNGSEETFVIREFKKENDLLYITVLTPNKKEDNISYYRINLNKDATENGFIHQYYYPNLKMTYGIISDRIEILACE